MPQIEVTFDIDANGILHVTAKDKATGKEQSIRITASSGLAKDEVDRMVATRRRMPPKTGSGAKLVDSRNRADTLIYQTEKTLKEFGDKVPTARQAGDPGRDCGPAPDNEERR